MGNVLARRKAPRLVNQGLNSDTHYPNAGEISLFDMPALMRQCIDALKAKGMGRVELHHLVVVNGKLQLHIKYFRALDRIGERIGIGYDVQTGHYACFALPVNAVIEVVWTVRGGL